MTVEKEFYQEILKIQYKIHLLNAGKLAKIRNNLLKTRHTKLPSYCFWTHDDLALETLAEREKWMTNFIADPVG